MRLQDIEKKLLLGILKDAVINSTYMKFNEKRICVDRFVSIRRIKNELKKQAIDWSTTEVREAYDRLYEKGLCDKIKRGRVYYSILEFDGHDKIHLWFVKDKE